MPGRGTPLAFRRKQRNQKICQVVTVVALTALSVWWLWSPEPVGYHDQDAGCVGVVVDRKLLSCQGSPKHEAVWVEPGTTHEQLRQRLRKNGEIDN